MLRALRPESEMSTPSVLMLKESARSPRFHAAATPALSTRFAKLPCVAEATASAPTVAKVHHAPWLIKTP